jgi:hypothetical protein
LINGNPDHREAQRTIREHILPTPGNKGGRGHEVLLLEENAKTR